MPLMNTVQCREPLHCPDVIILSAIILPAVRACQTERVGEDFGSGGAGFVAFVSVPRLRFGFPSLGCASLLGAVMIVSVDLQRMALLGARARPLAWEVLHRVGCCR